MQANPSTKARHRASLVATSTPDLGDSAVVPTHRTTNGADSSAVLPREDLS